MLASDIIQKIVSEKSAYLIRFSKQQDFLPAIWYDAIPYVESGKKRGFILLDLFTANAMLTVYNKLSNQGQIKYNRLPIQVLVDATWRVTK